MFDFFIKPILGVLYLFLVISPIFIFVFLLYKLKNKFFDLKYWEFKLKQNHTMYKIIIPEDFGKGPRAMEIILSTIWNTSKEGNWYSKRWSGGSRPEFSLEIISIGGKVNFYIRTRDAFEKVIESAFKANYPSIKLEKVDDYAKEFSYKKDANGGLFGFEAKLTKADPIPIKTYKKFGLDKDKLNAEDIIDPVSYFVQTLSNISEGENMWLQFVIRGQKKDYTKKKRCFWKEYFEIGSDETHDWNPIAQKEIEKIKKDLVKTEFQTDREKKLIDEIIENISKPSFWVGTRIIYFAKKGKFDGKNINPILMFFQPLKSEEYNSFSYSFHTGFDYKWQDIKGKKTEKLRKDIFNDFKRRKYFSAGSKEMIIRFAPGKRYRTFVLSTEELATVFHPIIKAKK